MRLMLVSDIFGDTPALRQLAEAIDGNAKIVHPYRDISPAFNTEQDAYQYFSERVGLAQYAQFLLQELKDTPAPVFLLGFSVGASAIWQLSGQLEPDKIALAKGYYGSQIRNHLSLTPCFPMELVFPASEPHFCVAELMAALQSKQNLIIRQTEFRHGFMNKLSVNFCREGYQQELEVLNNCFTQQH
ncbi:hypothetical protein [Planctobacterium marinum]|uniref:hypothetical protein n=1 Tax=Planctobacterium marinum TaxID=1631968 RepID=UPI001E38E485|nr:hypothetical protein [Planctobacterium marinum]MCC2605261.1 hypothetical protein [Planctobacterium marinum]